MASDNDKLRIHFIYCVAILLGMLILVATDGWTGKERFTEYLTNAATMVSLVLALVAIFYSFISNDGLSKSLGNISTVSEEVKQSKEQIRSFLDLTTSSTQLARENTEAIHSVSREVGSTLKVLDSTLAAIASRTDALNSAISVLPTRLDQLESNVLFATKTLGEKVQSHAPADSSQELSTGVVEAFLEQSSLATNLLTYACVLSYKTKKPLSIKDFCTSLEIKYPAFLNGYLSCMHAVDLITVVGIEAQNSTYSIPLVHRTLLASAREYFVDYVRSNDDNRDDMAKWLHYVKKVEQMFETDTGNSPSNPPT